MIELKEEVPIIYLQTQSSLCNIEEVWEMIPMVSNVISTIQHSMEQVSKSMPGTTCKFSTQRKVNRSKGINKSIFNSHYSISSFSTSRKFKRMPKIALLKRVSRVLSKKN